MTVHLGNLATSTGLHRLSKAHRLTRSGRLFNQHFKSSDFFFTGRFRLTLGNVFSQDDVFIPAVSTNQADFGSNGVTTLLGVNLQDKPILDFMWVWAYYTEMVMLAIHKSGIKETPRDEKLWPKILLLHWLIICQIDLHDFPVTCHQKCWCHNCYMLIKIWKEVLLLLFLSGVRYRVVLLLVVHNRGLTRW